MTKDPEPKSSKTVTTDDAIYRNSSQYRIWSFTKQDLAERHQTVHQAAVEKLRDQIEAKSAQDIVEPLTLEEEIDLVRFYASKVEDLAQIFRLPSHIKATAMSYFRKFYLVHSVMDYSPKNILYACVFLASKSENYFISIEQFCAALPRNPSTDTILDLEFLILQSLSFTLQVHNGLNALHGFFLDMQAVEPHRESEFGDIHQRAKAIVVRGFVSDAVFLFTPPQIALAALYTVDQDLTIEYLQARCPNMDFLLDVVKECQGELLNLGLVSPEEGKLLDKKLHQCFNIDKTIAKRKSLEENGGGVKRQKIE